MKKTILKKHNNLRYWFFYSNSFETQIISNFLTDSYDEKYYREWILNDKWIYGGSELIELEKRQQSIVFSDTYDESENKFEFIVSRETFLKILDEWNIAKNKNKKFIVIQISDDNTIHIYGLDQFELSPQEIAKQEKINQEMYKKIESHEPFKSLVKGKK